MSPVEVNQQGLDNAAKKLNVLAEKVTLENMDNLKLSTVSSLATTIMALADVTGQAICEATWLGTRQHLTEKRRTELINRIRLAVLTEMKTLLVEEISVRNN